MTPFPRVRTQGRGSKTLGSDARVVDLLVSSKNHSWAAMESSGWDRLERERAGPEGGISLSTHCPGLANGDRVVRIVSGCRAGTHTWRKCDLDRTLNFIIDTSLLRARCSPGLLLNSRTFLNLCITTNRGHEPVMRVTRDPRGLSGWVD